MKTIFLALLIVILLVNRQLKPRPINTKMLLLPILLMLYVSYLAYQAGVEVEEATSLLITVLMGIGVGWLQGRFTRVYQSNGVWMTVGSMTSILVWLLSIPIRLIVKYGFVELLDIEVKLVGNLAYVPILFSLGAIILGRALYLVYHNPIEFREAANTTRYERRQARRMTNNNND